VLVCKQSAVEIRPKQLSHQLRTLYMHQLQSLASLKLVCLVVDQVLPTLHAEPLLEPSREALIRLRGAPIPHSRPRIGCDSCPFLCACVRVMQRHYNANHAPNHDDASDLCAASHTLRLSPASFFSAATRCPELPSTRLIFLNVTSLSLMLNLP